MEMLTITQPDDWHLHLRDGDKLQRTVLDSARQFKRAIIMPNLKLAITTIEAAESYRQRIVAHIPEGSEFEPLMSLYLTDNTTADLIRSASKHPHIHAVKLYPAGATTNSAEGVTDIKKVYPAIAAMQETGLPLLLHGEVTHGDIFDREKLFIDEILIPLRHDFPELKIVLEHITTKDAVDFIKTQKKPIAATITPHHLLFNRNAIFAGGIKPDYYCLPVLKRHLHQQALVKAATSGNSQFFLGTDSAPHSIVDKYNACGCAGIYNAHNALELYTAIFAAENALDKLETFASFNGADFYGLVRNNTKITLTKEKWLVPETLTFADEKIIPLLAGEEMQWKIAT